MAAPLSKFAAQEGSGQALMPVGVVDRVPLPPPDRVTVSVCKLELNVAATLWDRVISTIQVVAAEARTASQPSHPAKTEPASDSARSEKILPSLNCCEQTRARQSMPRGSLRTLPLPLPPRRISSVKGCMLICAATSPKPPCPDWGTEGPPRRRKVSARVQTGVAPPQVIP